MDRTDGIAVFVEVADRGSFAEAARRLGRSPAAGHPGGRGTGIASRRPAAHAHHARGQHDRGGERFLGGARRVLADLEEIERAAAGEGTAPRGEAAPDCADPVRTAATCCRSSPEFLDRFPEVLVALTLLDRTVDLVDEGFDIAVAHRRARGKAPRSRPGSVPVPPHRGRFTRTIWPGAERRRCPADLEAHAVVAFSGIAGVEHWLFRAATGEASIAIQPRLVVTTAEAAMDAARTGVGLTRVLSYQAAEDVARGSLLRVLPAYEGDEVPIHLVYPGGRHPPPKLRAFLDFSHAPLAPPLRRCGASDLFLTASSCSEPSPAIRMRNATGARFPSTGFKSSISASRGITDPPRPACAFPRTRRYLPRRRASSCS
jgi:DNA-binding transcriptional LysR family regulator